MTSISNSVTISSTTPLPDVNQKILESIQNDLKAQGVEGKALSAFQILNTVTNDDGSLTVTYQLNLEKPQTQPEGSTQRAANALNGLGDSVFVDIGQIMALFHQVAQDQRNAAQEGRQAALKTQVASLEGAAQDIRDSAAAAFAGAIVMGLAQIGSGLISIGAAAKMGSAIKTASPAEVKSGALSNQINQISTGSQGWSSLVTGVGTLGKGVGDFVATGQQADSKMDEAAAAKAGAMRDELIDYQSRMQQVMADVRQMVQQIAQNQMETARAILRV